MHNMSIAGDIAVGFNQCIVMLYSVRYNRVRWQWIVQIHGRLLLLTDYGFSQFFAGFLMSKDRGQMFVVFLVSVGVMPIKRLCLWVYLFILVFEVNRDVGVRDFKIP